MNRRFLLIYCALNAAFALLGLALCGGGFFGTGSFSVRALAWLLSLEAGFLGIFGAVYFSFRAYRNKIEDELRAGKYDEILNSENFSGANSGVEISNAQNSEDAVNFTSGETRIENGDSCALHNETAADENTENFAAEYDRASTGECDVNSTKSDDKTSAYNATALGHAADKFNMKDCATCGNLQSDIRDEASDSSQGDIGERCDDFKSAASNDLGDGTDSGNRGGDVDSSEPGDGTSDFGGGIGAARDGSKDDFEGADGSADDWNDECERSEVRSNFAGAFFSPFKILSYAALVAAIYLLAKLSLLNPLAIILGVAIIPLGTMIVAFADKDAR